MGNEVLTILASTSAGIAMACLFLAVIDVLRRIEVERNLSEDVKQLPVLLKLFMPLTPTLTSFVNRPLFSNQRDQTGELIMMAGFDQVINASQFISIRIFLGVVGFLIMGLSFLTGNPIMGCLLFLVVLAYPMAWLRGTIRRRHLEIQKALPNVLDLLTLSVEAGKDFLTALKDILERRKNDALTEEMGRTLREIQLGKQRRVALRELVNRVRQPDLTSVINAIIQADEMGVSIGQLLRVQGDQFRVKRFQRAEKLANEAPVKILFPVIAFIFPAVIVILMAPIIMQALKTIIK